MALARFAPLATQFKEPSAIFIDGDNLSFKLYPKVLETLRDLNMKQRPAISRVYGDVSSDCHKGWTEVTRSHCLENVHVDSFKSLKNSTDMRIVSDIYKELYSPNPLSLHPQTFIIASNDSDYLQVCRDIREQGKSVVLIISGSTKEVLKKNCDHYVFVSNNRLLNELENHPVPIDWITLPKDMQHLATYEACSALGYCIFHQGSRKYVSSRSYMQSKFPNVQSALHQIVGRHEEISLMKVKHAMMNQGILDPVKRCTLVGTNIRFFKVQHLIETFISNDFIVTPEWIQRKRVLD